MDIASEDSRTPDRDRAADADSSWVIPLDATLICRTQNTGPLVARYGICQTFGAALSGAAVSASGAAYYKTETIEYERQGSLMAELPPGGQIIGRNGIN